MTSKEPSVYDLIIESHLGLERQGPGSPEVIAKALNFLDGKEKFTQAADLGCGTGGQTRTLAQHIGGNVVGVDICPDFIARFNEKAEKSGLGKRLQGMAASILELSFPQGSLDLIWSEGVIDSIGFEKGLTYWYDFLKQDGYIAVTCPSWLTAERPAEIEKFWQDAVGGLDTVADNTAILQKAGYDFIASFVLPETCWTENYFVPRKAAEKELLKKYAGSKTAAAYAADEKYEAELYEKYKRYYGYVFYIGKKCETLP